MSRLYAAGFKCQASLSLSFNKSSPKQCSLSNSLLPLYLLLWPVPTSILWRKQNVGCRVLVMPRQCRRLKTDYIYANCLTAFSYSKSDCSTLIGAFPDPPNFSNKCTYSVHGIFHTAFNTACYGNCKYLFTRLLAQESSYRFDFRLRLFGSEPSLETRPYNGCTNGV